MAITRTNYNVDSYSIASVDTFFLNRVIRIETTIEDRNWSDTLDYTDYRSTNVIRALVWLGNHGVPPETRHGRPMVYVTPASWEKTRDLEFHEQFAWIDCTNLFTDRNGYALSAAVDGEHGMFGDPLMWANLIAWESHHAAVAAERDEKLRKDAEARAAQQAKVTARQAKQAVNDTILKTTAEGMLARIPAKGTEVTVDGFNGKVFWVGVSKYRGKWSARAGVKNTKGEVAWVPAEKF